MITEISNYIDSIKNALPFLLYESNNIRDGDYHIYSKGSSYEWVKLSEFSSYKGKVSASNETEININDLLEGINFGIKIAHSKLLTTNKALDLPGKKILSCNPYYIYFKAKNLENIKSSLDVFYKKCLDVYKDILVDTPISASFLKTMDQVYSLTEELRNGHNYQDENTEKGVFIFFNEDISVFEGIKNLYLKDKIYVTTEYNQMDGEYGISSFLNGANKKKPYVMPQTTFIPVNSLVPRETALNLNEFENILSLSPPKLPNPLPVFIYKEELNNELIRIIKQSGRISFHEIIRSIYISNKQDLHNYYLINWARGEGIIINDFDFVENFKFEIENMKITDLFSRETVENTVIIKNIFHFEQEVCSGIFFDLLITKPHDKEPVYHYFDDIIKSKFYAKIPTRLLIHNLNLYRNNFYNYIYKGKSSEISGNLFYRLIIENSLDYLFNTKDPYLRNVKNALNILFCLNKHFDKHNKNFGGRDMPTQIPEYYQYMAELIDNADNHLNDDYIYAYAAGQVIYYLLSQSKTGNKTHSLFEPFMNKSNVESFNEQMLRVFNQYKHEIAFNSRKFNKLFSEVLGYQPKTSFNELRVIILTGYLSENIIYSYNNKKTEEPEDAE
ncbi:MAG: hypothetical protein L6Q47_16685 [Ignavibacteriaceae bacterium]|nr:hypothetical protein [Ignavibacteriaceae bacterium]